MPRRAGPIEITLGELVWQVPRVSFSAPGFHYTGKATHLYASVEFHERMDYRYTDFYRLCSFLFPRAFTLNYGRIVRGRDVILDAGNQFLFQAGKDKNRA